MHKSRIARLIAGGDSEEWQFSATTQIPQLHAHKLKKNYNEQDHSIQFFLISNRG